MKRKLILFIVAMLFSGAMYAQREDGYQSVHWPDFDYHQFVRPMTVIGQVYFDDEVQNRADIEVAAFVGEELRGRWNLIRPYPDDNDPEWREKYFVYLPCYYNTPGETFSFKAYDIANDVEYDICSMTLVGQDDGYGNPDNPYDFHFTSPEQPEVPTYGPEYPWVGTTAYDGEGMLVVAQIQIDGQLVDRATYEVGAFCGDECRGTSVGDGDPNLVDFTDVNLGYFAWFNIMGNNGDQINFYLYDLENHSICPVKCYTTLEMVNSAEVGSNIFGGDIFILNFVTEQTFEKEILAYTDVRDHYYLIASPIGEVNPDKVENMMSNNYDLYYFDQAGDGEGNEWVNIHDGNTNLVSGTGYLYANSGNVTLKFKGFPYGGDGNVTLVKNVGENTTTNFEGWNLVGNPFAKKAYISKPFYKMNVDGYELLAQGGEVGAMEGIFVIADEDEEVLNFSTTQPTQGKSQIVLNVFRDRGNVVDRAIVRFGEESTLPKFMLNENNTKIYIPQDGKDFAVVTSAEAGEIPVSFKADHNGSYSIQVNAEELDVNYMHLIDNLTGADVDLLQNPSYSFNAQTTDYASRFKLVFATGVNDDVFGFYSNGNWIINNDGDAVLQVVDVTGRIMSSEEIHGSCSKRIEAAPGVYMLRLVKGDNMKVQKIVVK